MGRPVGTEIQPENHQDYALNMLDYIRSLELIATSTLIGVAESNTTPVQPNSSRVCYIAGVAQNQTVVFENFIDENGNPISVTTGDMEGVFIILLWNTQYWSAQTFSTNIISHSESATFYYRYNIRKTYASIALMNADVASPIGTDGKYIKVGDIVTVVNSTTPSENGIYSYEGATDGWQYQSSFNFQLEQIRSQNTNTAPSSKLFDDESNKNECYNVTNRIPLSVGQYYDLASAIAAVPVANRKLGLKLTYMSALYEKDTLTITSAPNSASNIVITLNGVSVSIALDSAVDTTPTLVATKIKAATFTGWTLSGTGATVIFTKNVIGVCSAPVYDAGTTGSVGSFVRTVMGTTESIVETQFNGNSISSWTTDTNWRKIVNATDIAQIETNLNILTNEISVKYTNKIIDLVSFYENSYVSGWTGSVFGRGTLNGYSYIIYKSEQLQGNIYANFPISMMTSSTVFQVFGGIALDGSYLFNLDSSKFVNGFENANKSIRYIDNVIYLDIDLLKQLYPTLDKIYSTVISNNLPYFVTTEKVVIDALKMDIQDVVDNNIIYTTASKYRQIKDTYVSGWNGSSFTFGSISGLSFTSFMTTSIRTYGKIAEIEFPFNLMQIPNDFYVIAGLNNSGSNAFMLHKTLFVNGFENANKSIRYIDNVIYIDFDLLYALYPDLKMLFTTIPNESIVGISNQRIRLKSKLEGLRVCFDGDSLTANGGWINYVKNELGLYKAYNRGISGSSISYKTGSADVWYINNDQYREESIVYQYFPGTNVGMPSNCSWMQDTSFSNQERINTIPDDSDIVVLWGGVNDVFFKATSLIVGNINKPSDIASIVSYDKNKLQEALCLTIDRIYNRVPNASIKAIGIPYSSSIPNNNNGTADLMYSANEAIKSIYKLHGIDFLDILNLSGINKYNYSRLTDGVHPTVGQTYKLYSDLIVKFLKQ